MERPAQHYFTLTNDKRYLDLGYSQSQSKYREGILICLIRTKGVGTLFVKCHVSNVDDVTCIQIMQVLVKMSQSCQEKYIYLFAAKKLFPNQTNQKIKITIHGTV